MQVAYHLGAHCTDEERLFRCLLKNRGELAREGVIVSGPGKYRPLLREAMNSLQGQPGSEELQTTILDSVCETDNPSRLVFSNEQFFSAAHRVMDENALYAEIGAKSRWLRNVFPAAETEFFLGIRNPATFVPAIFGRADEENFVGFMEGIDPFGLRWSVTIDRLRQAHPDARICVWCNEDTPLIWPDILAAIAGSDIQMKGENDFLSTIMSDEGLTRMEAYTQTHPPQNKEQRIRIVSAFLDKYALADEVEVEIELPGWTDVLVDQLSGLYVEDCEVIAQMEGVEFLCP